MSNLNDPVILVIDNQRQSADITRLILAAKPYQVHATDDAGEALTFAADNDIDLVICDISAANQQGVELAATIRELPEKSDVPLMFTSNTQLTNVSRRKHEFGDAFHLKKPFEPQVLLEIVECALWMPALVQSHLQLHEKHSEPIGPHFIPDGIGTVSPPNQLS